MKITARVASDVMKDWESLGAEGSAPGIEETLIEILEVVGAVGDVCLPDGPAHGAVPAVVAERAEEGLANSLFNGPPKPGLMRPTKIETAYRRADKDLQDRDAHAQMPALRKMRTHHYDAVNGSREPAALLDRFLAGSE